MFYNTFEGFFWLFLMTDFACFYEQPTNIFRHTMISLWAAFVELGSSSMIPFDLLSISNLLNSYSIDKALFCWCISVALQI